MGLFVNLIFHHYDTLQFISVVSAREPAIEVKTYQLDEIRRGMHAATVIDDYELV